MPIIQNEMLNGRDTEARASIVSAATDASCRVSGNRPETVYVVAPDVPLECWSEAGMTEAVSRKGTG